MSNNKQVADNFIRQTGLHTNANTCTYHGDIFRSYNTAFAKIDVKNKVLLISSDSMTHTSSEHKGALVASALEHGYKILPIPLRMFEYCFPDTNDLIKRFENTLDYYSEGTKLALTDNRYNFLQTYDEFKEFATYCKRKPRSTKRFDKTVQNIEDVTFIKELQKKRRQQLRGK